MTPQVSPRLLTHVAVLMAVTAGAGPLLLGGWLPWAFGVIGGLAVLVAIRGSEHAQCSLCGRACLDYSQGPVGRACIICVADELTQSRREVRRLRQGLVQARVRQATRFDPVIIAAARQQLRQMFEAYSEARWGARWMIGLEEDLWGIVFGNEPTPADEENDIDAIRELASALDGWWEWGEDEAEPSWVTRSPRCRTRSRRSEHD